MELPDEDKKRGMVTFNSRYMPINEKIKDIIESNCLGKIYSVQYHYCVDDAHSTEYFRRWHRLKENSGTLLIHKSVHHFDLVNWWLNDSPVSVTAEGCLLKYGGKKEKNNLTCRTCKETCEYRITEEKIKELSGLYFNNEKIDKYYRDSCVFASEINIYDTMSAQIMYSKGTLLDYSLLLYSSYTGFYLKISGENGQLIVDFNNSKQVNEIKVLGKTEMTVKIDSFMEKKHNGADDKLQRVLFDSDISYDKSNLEDGIRAVLIGIAADESIEKGKRIKIDEL